MGKLRIILISFCIIAVQGCDSDAWNNPYPDIKGSDNALYTSFSERPKHLDPAISYNADEWIFTNQIYEPPLQYHYLKRPYELMPLIAQSLPTVTYLDKDQKVLAQDAPIELIAYSVYQIKIKPGILYQQHPAFAKKEGTDEFLYQNLTAQDVHDKHTLQDFTKTATREVEAADFIYQIKRLADPTLNSPILGLMENYIVGLKEFAVKLQKEYRELGISENNTSFFDLRTRELEGVKLIDKYTYEIKLYGKYPQFSYWLAMPFYAPMPWEAVKFYAQNVLLKKNISLDWYPVGTGPYTLAKNNPNLQMVLAKNPTFHGERYPSSGEASDGEKGLLKFAGQPLPFLDKIIFILEKESIPYWSKFLQGYYDQSGISADNFDQALNASASGNLELTKELMDKGIRVASSIQPTNFYWGFNMLDEVVGGYSEKQKKLRQAISIAVDMEEYVNIFLNGNAVVAQGPLPPSIFGFNEDKRAKNPYIYDVNTKDQNRKSIAFAKELLKQAGYPEGIDSKTQKPLVLFYDAIVTGTGEAQSQFSWLRKQFQKIGIELVVRATQYNRFQDKMRNGDFQIYFWGWNADYPDPENFLFLLYGKNSKLKKDGENASNYENLKFDALFEQIKSMENTPERKALLGQMLAIAQEDAPWIWGFHPKTFVLRQAWVNPFKTNAMSRNTLKYMSIEPSLRTVDRLNWNKPIIWPLVLGFICFILVCIPAYLTYWHKTKSPLLLKKPVDLKEK
ncbi:MAG: ABC transporter substrate-binding protein [Proteobacteria bacterium]|nr:ABC transporter substrate-binding protein [Pseudomonadota bacterium]